MPRIFFLVITWIWWALLAQGAVYAVVYLTSPPERTNTFVSQHLLLSVGTFVALALFGGGIRYALTKIKNQWVVLVCATVGLFFSLLPIYFGAFLAPEFRIVFQALSVLLFITYIPQFLFPKAEKLVTA